MRNPSFVTAASVTGYLFLCVLELSAYAMGPDRWTTILASRIWLTTSIIYFGSAAWLIARSIYNDLRVRDIGTLLVLLVTAAVVFYGLGDIHFNRINDESVVELAAALENLKRSDLGYLAIFVPGGYPARQYIWPALPAALMGRQSLFWQQAGYAILFSTGVAVFFVGLRASLEGRWPKWAAIPAVLSIFTFPFLCYWLFFFEQAMLPLIYGLHLTGWALLARKNPRPLYLFNLMVLGSVLGTCYTPALAGVALLILFLVDLAWKALRKGDKKTAIRWLSIGLVIAVVTAAAYFNRRDFHPESRSATPFATSLVAIHSFFIGGSILGHRWPFLGHVWLLPASLWMIAALLGRLGWRYAVIVLWLFGVIVVSGNLAGQSGINPPHTSYRLLMTIPVLIAAIMLSTPPLLLRAPKGIRVVSFLIITGLIVAFDAKGLSDIKSPWQPRFNDRFIAQLLTLAKRENLANQSVNVHLQDDRLDHLIVSRYLSYFLPTWRALKPTEVVSLSPPALNLVLAKRLPGANSDSSFKPLLLDPDGVDINIDYRIFPAAK